MVTTSSISPMTAVGWSSTTVSCSILRSGRIVAEHVGIVNLTNDGHAVAKALDGTMRSFDLETGRLLWTLQATVNTLGYVIMFPNGCVKVSSGAEKFVRLVHGFASRPFDDAARSTFAKPTCKGVPAAIAASEASFQAERAHVASLARADVDEQARKRRQAEAEAAQSEARSAGPGSPVHRHERRKRAAPPPWFRMLPSHATRQTVRRSNLRARPHGTCRKAPSMPMRSPSSLFPTSASKRSWRSTKRRRQHRKEPGLSASISISGRCRKRRACSV